MRLIDADALKVDYIVPSTSTGTTSTQYVSLHQIINAPTIEPQRKRGEWIRNDNGTYSCSVCQSWIPEEQHCYARYCLYCGADMRGAE